MLKSEVKVLVAQVVCNSCDAMDCMGKGILLRTYILKEKKCFAVALISVHFLDPDTLLGLLNTDKKKKNKKCLVDGKSSLSERESAMGGGRFPPTRSRIPTEKT